MCQISTVQHRQSFTVIQGAVVKGIGIDALPGEVPAGPRSSGGFEAALSEAAREGKPVALDVQGEAGPGVASLQSSRSGQSQGKAMPDDADFMIVDEVSLETTADGEEIVNVSGVAVTKAQADAAVERDGELVVSLPEARLSGRMIAGSMFAGMLIDQRNGNLPNPFSLMRLPPPPEQSASVSTVDAGSSVGITPTAPYETQQGSKPDAGDADALAMGKEMSRLEAAISVLIQKLTDLLRMMRVLDSDTSQSKRMVASEASTEDASSYRS
jgi:hypothetical protein